MRLHLENILNYLFCIEHSLEYFYHTELFHVLRKLVWYEVGPELDSVDGKEVHYVVF